MLRVHKAVGRAVMSLLPGLLGVQASAQALPQGNDFVVDAPGTTPDVAMDAVGSATVTWCRGGNLIYARRYAPNGVPLGAAAQVSLTVGNDPAIARLGGGYVYAWVGGSPTTRIRVRYLPDMADPASPSYAETDALFASTHILDPDVAVSAAVGAEVFVVGTQVAISPNVIRGRFLGLGGPGLVLGAEVPNVSSADATTPAVAGAGTRYMVVWVQLGASGYEVHASIFDGASPQPTVPAVPEFTVYNTGITTSSAPDVAGWDYWVDGEERCGFAVAWRAGANGLRARRFKCTGQQDGVDIVLDPDGIYPSVAANPSNGHWLATWVNGGNLLGSQFGADGTMLTAVHQVNTSSGGTNYPEAAASRDEHYFVAWWHNVPAGVRARSYSTSTDCMIE